jgi:hypothetical protein
LGFTSNARAASPMDTPCSSRIAELERKVGQQALEIDFLKGCLQRIEEQLNLSAQSKSLERSM